MENPELNKIADFRQSPGWGKFLESLGWKRFETRNGVNIYILKSFFGGVAKIQRPRSLTLADLSEIDDICLQEHTMFVKVEPSIGQDLKILEAAGFSPSAYPLLPPSTVFIDLSKPQMALWEQLSRSAKYSVQRAEREGAIVETHQNPGEKIISEMWQILSETGKAKKILTPSVDELKIKVEAFGDESFIILVRNPTGKIVAGNFYFGFKDCVWFLHGGTSLDGRKGRWGHELLWKSFLYFKDQGYKWLDLEGRDDPRFPNFTKTWGGFSHFKEKFGGINVQFPSPQLKLYSPILKFLKRIYGKIPL